MSYVDFIGLLAGIGTSFSLVPQAIKIYRSKSAKDVSTGMFLVFSTGVALWLYYGFLISAWPVILTNGFALFMSLLILGMKIRY
ncbi:MAG: hypothetical protein D6767_01240 [Candidatus Hydrogenedentota bacterium]|nr:MAG: hypothetical protein D6767_01240 [Candidatus Hydrogenedentota bacterium]